jgi:hypothetical protein
MSIIVSSLLLGVIVSFLLRSSTLDRLNVLFPILPKDLAKSGLLLKHSPSANIAKPDLVGNKVGPDPYYRCSMVDGVCMHPC